MAQLTIEITPEEEGRLQQLAQKEGRLPTDIAHRILGEGLVREQPELPQHASTHRPRVLGLHLGAAEMCDDFNDPLPDSFWLGEE